MDDVVSVRLKLEGIKVVKIEENSQGDLIIYAETTETGVYCHRCGKFIKKRHGTDRAIKLRHLSVFESETYVMYNPHRYIC